MSGAGENKSSQLLAEIEEFSRHGPRTVAEDPKTQLHRETLEFPDLNKAAVPAAKSPATAASQTAAGAAPAASNSAAANSLLARLKQQAATMQQDAGQRDAQLEMRAQLLSASLGAAFHYLDDLIKQLNIIKPPVPKEFIFPGSIVFAGMSWVEGAADFRMVPTASEDRLYENLTVRYRLASPQKIVIERDALGTEPLRKQLHDFGVQFAVDEKYNARRQLERAVFSFPCEIKAGFVIKADYAAGNLILRTRNIDRFGLMEFRLKPEDLHQETMDELTKLFLGEPSRFLQMFRRSA